MEHAEVRRIFLDGKEELKDSVAFAWMYGRQGIMWLNLYG